MIIYILLFLIAIISVYFQINKAHILGAIGEKKVSMILTFLDKEYCVYNDVIIKGRFGTTQIDHIVVSPYGLFIIETKNYKGWIFGGEHSSSWVQNIWGRKYHFSNPIYQNRAHISSLKTILPQYSDNQYVSIIVFSSRASLRTRIPDSCNVLNSSCLIYRIKQYSEVILTNEQISNLCKELENKRIVNNDAKKLHVKEAKRKNHDRINSISNGVCPLCSGALVKRKGQFGEFHGCSNYPKCKFVAK